jgi:two-component system, LuxR family, response regulator FixJ
MKATVFVVDDDSAVRDSLTRLLAGAGDFHVRAYERAESFLDAVDPAQPGCVLLDMELPGMNGLDAQRWLATRRIRLPVIFLTAYGSVPSAVRAVKDGAFEFLEKPADAAALVACVRRALQHDAAVRAQAAAGDAVRARCATLTAREHQVLPLAAAGRSSKEIARELGISHRTVELHRSRIMKKIGADSVVDLVKAVEACGCSQSAPSGGD